MKRDLGNFTFELGHGGDWMSSGFKSLTWLTPSLSGKHYLEMAFPPAALFQGGILCGKVLT